MLEGISMFKKSDFSSSCDMRELSKKERKDIHEEIERWIDDGIERGNEITHYLHCPQCTENNLSQDISVGITENGLQVWCDNHNIEVLHILLTDNKADSKITEMNTSEVLQ